MIEKATIIALIVLSIHYSIQEKEIFAKLGDWLEDHLPDWLNKPVFDCPICMTPWYGSVLFWIIPWPKLFVVPNNMAQWPVAIIVAMGINIVINKWSPD